MAERTTDSPKGFSPARRSIVALGGVGVLAGIAGFFGFRHAPSPHQATIQKSATTAGEIPQGMPVETTPVASQGFHSYLNSEFVVIPSVGNEGETKCKLVEVSPEFRQDTFKGSFISFSLLFQAAPGFLPEGGICRMKHHHLEEMEIFLSPVGHPKDKTLLQAVFSERV